MKFDFAPLEPLIEAAWRPISDHQRHISVIGKAAQLTGIDNATFHKWRRDGLSRWAADRVACRLGYHPGLIWPNWWQP